MALQFSVALRNARLNVIESTIGTTPKLYLRTGAVPANAAAADSGTLIATIDLPSDWAGAASAGAVALINLPVSATAAAAGVIAHFRIKDSTGATTHIQGTVTETGGGGDLIVDNDTVEIGQTIQLTGYTLTEGNA
jgi:hypothetical protein